MKKLVTFILTILLSVAIFAQAPQSFKYQSVVRDANGNAMQNQAVDFRISILRTSSTGTPVYIETFSTTTNNFGLVNLNIGTGTVLSGTFSSIDWGADNYFLQIELDADGNGYQLMGTSQLLSVPYALNAAKADNAFSGDYNDLTNKPVLAGDVTGNTDNNTVEKIRGMEISTNIPGDGQVLKWDNATSKWIPADDNTVSGSGVDGVVTSIGVTGTGTKTITLQRSNGLGDLTAVFTDEINDADADATNELQVLSISNDTIYLTDGGFVKLPAGFSGDYNDLTNKPTIPTQTSDLINDSGFITSPDDADADPTNEIQTLSQSGTNVTLSNGGGTISVADNDNDSNNELQTISKSGSTVTLSNGGGSFTDEVNDADNSTTNELQILSQSGTNVTLSNGGGTISVADNDNDPTNEIQAISFSGDTLYLSNGSSVYLGNYSNLWQQNGNDIYYNNGYVGVGLTDPHGKLIVQGDASIPADSAIFEVRNKDGQVIFAVYQEGVRIYVDDTGSKGISSKGGFAIGGYNATKSLTNEYLRVTPDSVRVYIEEGTGSKAISSKGGFAIGGFNATKTFTGQYFNVSGSDSAGTIPMPGEARVMWYPLKEAFLSGHVIVESPDSVGQNSMSTGYQSKSIGEFSQAFGYKARAAGNNSTAIGNYANAVDSGSYAIGSGAKASGLRSFAIGSTGVDSAGNAISSTIASGDYSYAIGMGNSATVKGAFAIGTNNNADGYYSTAIGYGSRSNNWYATAIGREANAYGWSSLAIGYNAYTSGVGSYSMALGRDAKTYGEGAVSIGYASKALDQFSIAIGKEDTASADKATAIGSGNKALGTMSTAIGGGNKAFAEYSMALGMGNAAGDDASDWYALAMGYNTHSYGNTSTTMGNSTEATAENSTATGFSTHAEGKNSFVGGYATKATSLDEVVFGRGNYVPSTPYSATSWVATDPLFVLGNGSYYGTSGSNALTILKNAHTGINVEIPSEILDIKDASAIIKLTNTASNTESGIWFSPNFTSQYAKILYDKSNYNLNFYNKSTTPAMTIANTSMVGIGTATPSELLDIYGDSPNIEISNNLETEAGIIFNDIQDPTNQYAKILYSSSSNDLNFYNGSTTPTMTIDGSNVGIGTTSPGSHRLYVSSAGAGTSGITSYIENTASNGLAMGIINTSSSSSDNVLLVTQKGTGDIASFDSYHGTTGWDREFRFTNTGDGRCDGSWIAGGADYAEFFPKADINSEYEAGDIITMSPTKTYTVEGATNENSKLIVGVYSSNPAIIGNSEAEKDPENSVLVGMVGVIKTKVNTENGPIKIGDYITISSTPKVGMKATKTCMVVGRAMDNYNGEGIGLINVLVEVDWYYNTKDGDITSSEIKETFKKQANDINSLKAEVEQLKQILQVKAEK